MLKFGGFTKSIFHVFDRYEMNIQAFANVFLWKSYHFNPHLHKSILNMYTPNLYIDIICKKICLEHTIRQIFSQQWWARLSTNSNIFEFPDMKNNMLKDVPIISCIF